ncbi:MAG: tetratricopeptide repeat protein [Pirellulales bacterium]
MLGNAGAAGRAFWAGWRKPADGVTRLLIWTHSPLHPTFPPRSGSAFPPARDPPASLWLTLQGDTLVATLRTSTWRLMLSGSFVVAATASSPTCFAAEAARPPRTLMRLPAWIESIGKGTPPAADASPAESEVSTKTKPAPADVRTVAEWSDEEPAAPSQPAPTAAVPAPLTAEEGTTRPAEARAVAAVEPAGSAATADPSPPRPMPKTADETPPLEIDPASFRGALPGTTTRKELEADWGPGEEVSAKDGSTTLAWKIEPFERVEVTVTDDVVAAISITLAEPVGIDDLAEQLEIAALRTVVVRDDTNAEIGKVYPERGVLISVEPGTDRATAILIEPLDADTFVLRAEGEIDSRSASAMADLAYAIRVDPQHVRAHQLLLAMSADQGQWTDALDLATRASRLAPDDTWTRLKHAGVLIALERPDEAVAVLSGLATTAGTPPLVAAQAARLGGRAELARATPDFQKAVERFGEAIRLGAPLLSGPTPAVQAAVREVILDAHLGTALAIARGTWQQKSRVIPKWITRADAVVTEFAGGDEERQILELQLCRGVLVVAAATADAIEPLPWVKRLLELRDRMGDGITDPWRRRQLDWEVGQGLSDALAAAQKRGDANDALDNATLTAAYLERGAELRQLTATERKSLGELMFRIGIMHSLQRGDHATAVTWFDKALPLWDGNERFDREGELGRLGEAYVSMAISYWQVARRDDAVTISRRGVDLMVSAVDKSQLEERALAVAYGNLATMYAEQGDDAQAKNYSEMASRAEATGTIR